jgi:hypothetical protein
MPLDLPALSSCLIVGAGPGGLAPLFAAAHAGNLQDLLDGGVTILEGGTAVGPGELGRYAIRSDSAAEAFLDVVMRTTEPALAALQSHPTVTSIAGSIGGPIPLTQAGVYLNLIGETICNLVNSSPKGVVLRQHRALYAKRLGPRLWSTRVRCEQTGMERDLRSTSLVLATGASQPKSRLYSEQVAGAPLLPLYGKKLVQTGDVLSIEGLAKLQQRLRGIANPKVVVVGGSTSAGAAARVLLSELPPNTFSEGAITIMHRRPLRIFYSSAEEALAEGYTEFGPQDICPVSGRVYRLAGFRLDTREMIMQVRGIGGRTAEPRLRLHLLNEETCEQARHLLNEADLIVAGLGYRPRALQVYDHDDTPLPLMAENDAMRPMVDEECRILDASGTPIESLYGIGLASGFVPKGALGGEQSFQGQANSLWLWQHDQGLKIVNAVLQNHALVMSEMSSTSESLLDSLVKDASWKRSREGRVTVY